MPGNWFEQVVVAENLRRAWEAVEAKGRAGGADGIGVKEFRQRVATRLAALRRDLVDGCYVPEPGLRVNIPKGPGRQGTRPLSLPSVRDKVAQMAVRQVIEPVFESRFLPAAYAYRPGKGPERAIRRVVHGVGAEKRAWIARADIDEFFPSVDHRRLLARVEEVVADSRLLGLIELWLRMGEVDKAGHWIEKQRGLSQGGVVSPLLSNVYLHPFDRAMVEQGRLLVRYADDFLLLEQDRGAAVAALQAARDYLALLGLHLNHGAGVVDAGRGFTFLGVYLKGTVVRPSHSKYREIVLEGRRIVLGRGAVAAKRRRLGQAVEGWRRYYGRLCAEDSLLELDHELAKAWAALLGRDGGESLRSLQHWQMLPWITEGGRAQATDWGREAIARWRATGEAVGEVEVEHKEVNPKAVTESPGKAPAPTRSVARKRRRYQRGQALAGEWVVAKAGASIGVKGDHVVVRVSGKVVREAKPERVGHLTVLATNCSLSSNAIVALAEAAVGVDFVDYAGRPVARLYRPLELTAAAGEAQLAALENGRAWRAACGFILGKVKNQLSLLKYFNKYRRKRDPDWAAAFPAIRQAIEAVVEELEGTETPPERWRDWLRGQEAQAAGHYWQAVRRMLPAELAFDGRVRRGATDAFNVLLNYGYAVLYGRAWEAITRVGLNPHIGFLHMARKGKPTLLFDFVEEFRPQAVDRVVLAMVGRDEPVEVEGGRLSEVCRRRLLENVLERLHNREEFRGEEVTLLAVMRRQARELLRFLTGERPRYRPYLAGW